MNRRKLLTLLGVGAATSPKLLEKTLADEVMDTNAFMAAPTATTSAAQAVSYGIGATKELSAQSLHTYIKAFGPPAFMDEMIEMEARRFYGLDPDIAAKRSWSPAVKRVTQLERNRARARERIEKQADLEVKISAFQELSGIRMDWWRFFR